MSVRPLRCGNIFANNQVPFLRCNDTAVLNIFLPIMGFLSVVMFSESLVLTNNRKLYLEPDFLNRRDLKIRRIFQNLRLLNTRMRTLRRMTGLVFCLSAVTIVVPVMSHLEGARPNLAESYPKDNP